MSMSSWRWRGERQRMETGLNKFTSLPHVEFCRDHIHAPSINNLNRQFLFIYFSSG